MKKTIYFLFILAFSLIIVDPALARSKHAGSAYLVEVGLDSLKKGNKERAIHEFSKALLIDPTNREAKKYLAGLGVYKPLYKGHMTTSRQVADLSGHIKDFEQRLRNLEYQKRQLEVQFELLKTERDQLAQSNEARIVETKVLTQRVQEARNMAKRQKQYYDSQIKKVEEFYKEKIGSEMPKIKAPLLSGKEYIDVTFSDDYLQLSEKYSQLREEASGLRQRENQFMQLLEDYLYVRANEINVLEDELFLNEIQLTKEQFALLSKLDEMVDQVSTLRKQLDAANKKIERLEK